MGVDEAVYTEGAFDDAEDVCHGGDDGKLHEPFVAVAVGVGVVFQELFFVAVQGNEHGDAVSECLEVADGKYQPAFDGGVEMFDQVDTGGFVGEVETWDDYQDDEEKGDGMEEVYGSEAEVGIADGYDIEVDERCAEIGQVAPNHVVGEVFAGELVGKEHTDIDGVEQEAGGQEAVT